MKIQLIQDWQHEGGRVYPAGTILDMHPTDGARLIQEKIGKKPGLFKQILNKDGDNRDSKG